ncbi:GrpE, mitochondrial [Neolecta irregularis DAH-3]|uniref:GrpE protein homolog, mitochondrial n=1 Tax=Neolecta irregularis (strain DAH-3) TaxID=1198029 RepID=A0A1U7LNJ8_NEOID|nr:GrpE, mitochondrial [Neolecta irregularis DAH-3]|eukprot:OLL24209.1 GrpE, mitochondrial [Neolecta irregularis DAH-3]
MLRTVSRIRFAACRSTPTYFRPLLVLRPNPYSTEAPKPAEPLKSTEELQEKRKEKPKVESSGKAEITEAESKAKEIAELKDKYLRSKADYQNLQYRTVREVAAAKDYAIQKFAKDLIETVDNFERALKTIAPEHQTDSARNKEVVDLFNGVKMTEEIMMKTLAKHGLTRYDGIGEIFDPNVHEGIFSSPAPDKIPGTVFHCEQMGFMLNGRVMRPAKVGIVKA